MSLLFSKSVIPCCDDQMAFTLLPRWPDAFYFTAAMTRCLSVYCRDDQIPFTLLPRWPDAFHFTAAMTRWQRWKKNPIKPTVNYYWVLLLLQLLTYFILNIVPTNRNLQVFFHFILFYFILFYLICSQKKKKKKKKYIYKIKK